MLGIDALLLSNIHNMKNMKIIIVVASLFLGSSLHAGLYVKFDNLKGSSMNETYKDWSEASSFSVDGERNFSVVGAAVGKPNWAQFEITKTQDHVTSDLMVLFCTGKPIQTVTVTLTTQGGGGEELPIFEIKLSGATICSQKLGGNGYEQYAPTEVLSLGYQKISWRFTPISQSSGGLDTSKRTSGGWDLARAIAAPF